MRRGALSDTIQPMEKAAENLAAWGFQRTSTGIERSGEGIATTRIARDVEGVEIGLSGHMRFLEPRIARLCARRMR